MLLKNVIFPHKLPKNFDVTECEAIGRNGNKRPMEKHTKEI